MPYLTEQVIAHKYWFTEYEDLNEQDKKIVDIQNKFIDQFIICDEIVISVPLWNFSMPAILKSYFELLAKPWVTFTRTENWLEGLLKNVKTVYLVWAKWWFYKWQPWEDSDMLEDSIKYILNFFWIINIKSFWIEWVNSLSENDLNIKIGEIKKEIDKSF